MSTFAPAKAIQFYSPATPKGWYASGTQTTDASAPSVNVEVDAPREEVTQWTALTVLGVILGQQEIVHMCVVENAKSEGELLYITTNQLKTMVATQNLTKVRFV